MGAQAPTPLDAAAGAWFEALLRRRYNARRPGRDAGAPARPGAGAVSGPDAAKPQASAGGRRACRHFVQDGMVNGLSAPSRILRTACRKPGPMAALLVGLLCAAAAFPQTPGGEPDFESRSAHWSLLLDLVSAELDKPEIDHAVIEALRPQVEKLQREAVEAAVSAAADAEAVGQLLDALGPPPAEGGPPELATVAAERAALEERRVEGEGQVKQTELISLRARQVLARMAEARRERSARRLLERGPPPLSWTVLTNAGPHALGVVRKLAGAPFGDWFPTSGAERRIGPRTLFLPALVLSIVLVVPARRWMLRRYVRDREVETPSVAHRVRAAGLILVARGALPSLIGLVPLLFLLSVPVERGVAGDLLVATFGVTAGLFLAAGLARAALAPYSPDGWRLAPLTREGARGLYHRTLALAFLVGGLFFIEYPGARHLDVPRELVPFYRMLAHCALAGFVLLLLPGRLWRRRETAPALAPVEPGPSGTRGLPRPGKTLRIATALAAASIPVLSLAGFGALASYLATGLVRSVVLLGVAVIVHGAARDTITLALAVRDAGSRAGGEPGRDGDTILGFWLGVAADALLALLVAVALLMIWGLAWGDLGGWLSIAAEGVRIGSFRLSLADLLFSVAVFAALLVATRWLQRGLESRVFPRTRLDAGMRNSLKTTVGYAGLFVAVAAGVSTLGIDLSNLAIIAGALSVGIGFGLQNVVNNFVSGLILLMERPVKVGDWIVVGEHQGYVQRINVRATEIRTFQRSSVIIPNSELLSSSLVNWTHKDAVVRVEIPVGVAYASDVAAVRDTLMEIAASHPDVLRDPEPFLLFTDFGESSLDFSLRCYAHADLAFGAATEIRFEIVRRFREQGIEIPFPQRDLHVHGLEQPATGGTGGSDGGSPR